MKRKKKKLSPLLRVLLCSWCVLGLVLAYFIIDWALGLSKPEEPGNIDVFVNITEEPKTTSPVAPEGTKPAEPTPVPQAVFEAEYPHAGEMKEGFSYTDGVAYGLRYPWCADEELGDAIAGAAYELLEEKTAELAERDGVEKILLIDYEDGETVGLYSVLFYIETEIDGVKEIETKPYLYNKKKSEFTDAETLFADLAYRYVGERVNLLLAEPADASEVAEDGEESIIPVKPEGPFVGTREEFPEYVLTVEGAKFYYELEGERESIVIPYIALHTYMAVTENGTVVADGIRDLDPEKPMIALTFDDGPHYQQTPRLLKLLEEYDVKSTFFILGDRSFFSESNKKTVKMVADAGHEIASHTYSHKNLKTLTLEQLTDEIVKARENLYALTGEYPTFVRPPYGAYNDLTKEYSYAPLIAWNLDSKDWDFRDTEKVVNHVLSEAGDGKIVLMHDIHWFTVDAVEVLLPELIDRGYQIVTVRELFHYKGVELENGKVYHSSYN